MSRQCFGLEDVDPHVGQGPLRLARDRAGVFRLFLERRDAPVVVHREDAERRGLGQRDLDGRHGRDRAARFVALDQAREVHLVDVIARKDDDVARPFLLEQIDVLVDGVGGP